TLGSAVVTLVALLALATVARAHDTSFSALDLDLRSDGVAMRVTLHSPDIAFLLGEPAAPENTDAGRWLGAARRLAALLATRTELIADGRRLSPDCAGTTRTGDGRGLTLSYRSSWPHRPARLDVRARLLPDDPQHETFLNVFADGRVIRQEVLDARHEQATV